ncbi:tyrosine-type recombinase/integrase [Massilia dura]|uniref:Tyrosine-type recombinase/integrase n=2 Tax=Pseudoduganella dura TaxID=321982 RepID=A0A6I3XB88_9BURK|nr:tyrosine-type recombinase/integrase [Pseudoduganella dura]MUI13929.1 tyrosine-type recombinase/integrase [Pseudoduganella dura]GGX99033.1 integrase [Pseudoduganella dura]
MGRKNTRNLNMPPHMHPRTQRSGKVYYYMYQKTEEGKRKEIALGDDYILALKKYAELNIVVAASAGATFSDVYKRYLVDALPKLAASSARMWRSDIKHLLESFANAPLSQIKPLHVRQFLDDHADKPTTANRCKRVFSVMWNKARGWGYTDLPNPCEGIQGHSLQRRTLYISDAVYKAVWDAASVPLRDAMDLAYLTGQRPADALKMTEHDIIEGHLIVTQEKTKQPLRIRIVGELARLVERIQARKAGDTIKTAALLVNHHGKRLTAPALRAQFDKARDQAAEKQPQLAEDIKNFRFYDLRAKAADDTADGRGEEAARDLLGHDSVKTTQKHYLRRGKIVTPTK